MVNRAASTADEWIEIGYELFGDGGPAAVRIDEIARRLGVSRSGFYHRFENRRALLAAINERWLGDGMNAYVRAGELVTPEARLRGIGYFGLGDPRLRRADQWLLVRGPQQEDLTEFVDNVRERAVDWLTPQFVDLGFERTEAARRAYVYYVAYLGLGAEIETRREPVAEAELRDLVDAVVDLVIAPASGSAIPANVGHGLTQPDSAV